MRCRIKLKDKTAVVRIVQKCVDPTCHGFGKGEAVESKKEEIMVVEHCGARDARSVALPGMTKRDNFTCPPINSPLWRVHPILAELSGHGVLHVFFFREEIQLPEILRIPIAMTRLRWMHINGNVCLKKRVLGDCERHEFGKRGVGALTAI